MIDLVELFTELEVKHWTSGKNVSDGWVGIRCIFCNDSSNHLGVSLQHGNYSCWKCGSTGSLKNLLIAMGCSIYDARDLVRKHSTETHLRYAQEKQRAEKLHIEGFQQALRLVQREYLYNRRFDPDYLQQKYKIMGGTPLMGKWKWRIIVPVIMQQEMYTFTGMAIGGQDPKYLHCAEKDSVLPAKECLYNWDSVTGDQIGICEGVTDVWRMGDGFVATFGTKVTHHQIRRIVEGRFRRAFILFDADAPREASRLAAQLASYDIDVEVVDLGSGDPDDLEAASVLHLRRELGFEKTP